MYNDKVRTGKPLALLPQGDSQQISLEAVRMELEICQKELRRIVGEGYREAVPVRELLVILDDLERALKSAEKEEDHKAVLEGINLIYKNLTGLLEAAGVKRMEVMGEKFDPFRHKVLEEIDITGLGHLEVVEELRAGYTAGKEIIRQPLVRVGVIAKKGRKVFSDGKKGT